MQMSNVHFACGARFFGTNSARKVVWSSEKTLTWRILREANPPEMIGAQLSN
jgi:hypothetical protein